MDRRQQLIFIWCAVRRLSQRRDAARKRRLRRFRERQRKERLLIVTVLGLVLCTSFMRERSLWVKERSSDWWERIVSSFTQQEWVENFRMSQETFSHLCSLLRPYVSRQDTRMRKAVSVEKRVAITLWRLATNGDYRSIGHLFGVSKRSVCIIVKEVCSAIVETLLHLYVRIPSGDEVEEVVNGFETKWGFPQCAGAVDGTHIPIVAPDEYPTDYYNRKGFHSIIMQAVADYRYRFIDICIGWPGRVHDARVFANSTLYTKGEHGLLLPTRPRIINGVEVPLLLLGDPAYPLLPWLLKPFSDNGRLSEEQVSFNYRLSRARMVIENAFGRLKGRWRCLLKRNDMSINHMPDCIASCVVLHNICEIHKEQFHDEWLCTDDDGDDSSEKRSNPELETFADRPASATAIRNALMEHFIDHRLL